MVAAKLEFNFLIPRKRAIVLLLIIKLLLQNMKAEKAKKNIQINFHNENLTRQYLPKFKVLSHGLHQLSI